ncbi:glycosyltransferase [Vagococcus zengguangii]|uniref:Glycosyltransferase n=2 Tax=Vagococcus zengguangii TaxID=2571750 RepID=A0A4D7CSU0_9ENTE|nr:glycosyltransferase [Vagococcus zengguangii]
MSVYAKENPGFLTESIESMLNQTIKTDDFVIVKDGELTAELDNIIEKYYFLNPNIFNIISLSENLGLGKALDIGINHCKNELVARMDSDDISLPIRCELQLNEFEKDPELCIVGTNISEFYDNVDNIVSERVVPSSNEEIIKFMRRRSPFNHPTVMMKKSKVIQVGGYGVMKRKQDLDLFSRMINNNCKAKNIPNSLLLFRSNEDNFIRRKSWSYCSSYISVQYQILMRKHCTIIDFLYVLVGQLFIYLAPMWLLKKISNKFLRKLK